MTGSKEGRRERRRNEGRRSKRNAESGGTRGIIRPSTPQAHPLPPLFSYPLHTLPRATPLDHSRHSSYAPPPTPPSTALHLSLFPLYVSHSFDLVSRTSSLFTSRHAPTSCVPPNGVTYFAAIATNVHVVAKLLLTFCLKTNFRYLEHFTNIWKTYFSCNYLEKYLRTEREKKKKRDL